MFYVTPDTKQVILETFSWLSTEKTKSNTTKANMHPQQNILQHKINIKKLKPGLVTSYDLRPGNRMGLVLKKYTRM